MTRRQLAHVIGSRIRAARVRAKRTGADVAGRVGLGAGTYAGLESGMLLPSVELLRKLALELGSSADELLGLPPSGEQPARPLPAQGPEMERLLIRARALHVAHVRLLARLARALTHDQ